MDDLLDLSFTPSQPSNKQQQQAPSYPPGANYSSFSTTPLAPTPPPTSTTPKFNLNAPKPTPTPPKKATDSFARLGPFAPKNDTSKLSLQEQQRRLEAERARKAEEERRKFAAEGQFTEQFWDALSGGSNGVSRTQTPSLQQQQQQQQQQQGPQQSMKVEEGDDELFAAFKADAPVDNTSHYPPPPASRTATPQAFQQGRSATPAQQQLQQELVEDDDDPFGLSTFQAKQAAKSTPQPVQRDDDDILGALSRPIEEVRAEKEREAEEQRKREFERQLEEQKRQERERERERQRQRERERLEAPQQQQQRSKSPLQHVDPAPMEDDETGGSPEKDQAIAEIMDMGFTLTQAKSALRHTDTGVDVQAGIAWLLEEAHREAKAKQTGSSGPSSSSRSRHESPTGRSRPSDRSREAQPAWARENTTGEKDIAAVATEIGTSLFKSANSLWKQGRKAVVKAVNEVQGGPGASSGGDPSVPKWMREQSETPPVQRRREREVPREKHGEEREQPQEEITDEAMMLEMGAPPPPARRNKEQREQSWTPERVPTPQRDERRQSRNPYLNPPQKGGKTEAQLKMEEAIRRKEVELREREEAARRAREQLVKKVVQEDKTEGYVSPHRRRKATPAASKPAELEPDRNPFHQPPQQQQQQPKPAPRPTPSPAPAPRKPAPPARQPVPCAAHILQASATARYAGSAAFKRGDYPEALTHYTTALNPLPAGHLERILVLSNRALVNLKLGDPKSSLQDSDSLLRLIGPGRGEAETITVTTEAGSSEQKPLKEYWGKAVVRKAEALEQMEKYQDALDVWTLAVSSNVGGASATTGKRRCETALKPKPPPSAPKPTAKPAPRRPAAPTASSGAAEKAVSALRAANDNATAVEAERFALHDQVEARITKWKGGATPNLRALIAGLDNVLWENSGWKKVGLGDLVMANKVKINYMKAIARVHPDKIAQDATTEQRMISAAVFATLNEAWDRFKTENGM